jgi:isochorismate synthase/2-succinyl-5-enolpyruvyl-6-hydroxy-3-cyclohexene-1-carboxylate synthase/2-succinyl-6-hydroxy-2,4-cyclohexadiene-1-carboxylate synthase/O-succinylbenzoate synthase
MEFSQVMNSHEFTPEWFQHHACTVSNTNSVLPLTLLFLPAYLSLQVKIFGSYTRWHQDVTPPEDAIPGRVILSTLDTALRYTLGPNPGPVHLNLQFRDPLAPTPEPWNSEKFLQGLEGWMGGNTPYGGFGGVGGSQLLPHLQQYGDYGRGWGVGLGGGVRGVLEMLCGAGRGLLVVGELGSPDEGVAAVQIAKLLGWPLVTDVLSGLRVGMVEWKSSSSSSSSTSSRGGERANTTTSNSSSRSRTGSNPNGSSSSSSNGRCSSSSSNLDSTSSSSGAVYVHHMDQLLLGGPEWWEELRPDVVLQLGRHLTSKRLGQFLVSH